MLFHADIGFPKVSLWTGTLTLRYGAHALRAAQTDRYGTLTLPSTLDTTTAQVIEIEVIDGQVVKTLYRVTFDDTLDMCLAVTADQFVKTVWFNERNDTHQTLDARQYGKPTNKTPKKIKFR